MLLQQITLPLLLLTIFLFSSGEPAFSETRCYLQGEVSCGDLKKVHLWSFNGIKQIPFDSAEVINGKFQFCTQYSLPLAGYYRLQADRQHVDLVLSPEETPKINIRKCNPLKIQVENSLENELQEELKVLRRNFKEMDSQFLRASDSLLNKYPESFFTISTRAYLASLQTGITVSEYLSNIPFHYGPIVRSTLLPHLYMRFFRDYVSYDEDGFREATDTLLKRAEANNEVFEFTLDYLLNLFHQVGPEVIFEYIINTHYTPESCLDNGTYQERIKGYLSQRPGMKAPSMSVSDLSGHIIKLQEFYSSHTVNLLVFWSSFCPHCQKDHPIVKDLHEAFGDELGIIGFSIDSSREDCLETVKKESMKWPVICDMKGWDSEYASTFLINKTPTFILIDQRGNFISRNILAAHLNEEISRHLKSRPGE